MRRLLPLLLAAGFMAFAVMGTPVQAQKEKDKKKAKGEYDPPDAFVPSEDALKQIAAKTAQLAAKIAELRKDKKTHELLPDVEIYLRGAENIVRFKEYYSKDSGKWTLDALDAGLKRAEQLAKGETPWTTLENRNVLRAYRSNIDGTAQPYGVTYPLEYGKDPKRKWRVDVVLHGRNSSLTEVAFINSHNGNRKPAADQDWVQIDIFGRGNNAYRWAGETDVFEAVDGFMVAELSAGREVLPDPNRFVLRGFSMGGAGTWHLGLHYPFQWCVMGPGAGFSSTHDYAWKGKKDLPDYQERCLRIYDAIDYAENARMIPIVAYSGGADPQKRAADNVEVRLKDLKIDAMTHLVAPGLGHTMPTDWFKKANALWSKHAAIGRQNSGNVSLITWTLKYPSSSFWLVVVGLEKHYEKTSVEARYTANGWVVTTRNVRVVQITVPFAKKEKPVVVIDGQKVVLEPKNEETPNRAILVEKASGKWEEIKNLDSYRNKVQKDPGIPGPIDDAFSRGFVCVQGSGRTWHPSTQQFVDAKLKAFTHDWAKHWRGELPITNEYGITPNEIMDKHLILFGDPSSNFLLANILPKLPLKWTKDEIEFAGKKYKASEHVPVMIFPNPLNPSKYVVLNTGHTWPSEDYAKTNAMLYPRLGDYAILRMKGGADYEVATAGLFDEFWQVEKK